MPKEPKHEDWGMTQQGEKAKDSDIDDTRSEVESMESHNSKILGRQTPKKFG